MTERQTWAADPAEPQLRQLLTSQGWKETTFSGRQEAGGYKLLLHNYNQYSSDVWSRVTLLITISPMVIANTAIARNRNNSQSFYCRALAAVHSQSKPRDRMIFSPTFSCVWQSLLAHCLPVMIPSCPSGSMKRQKKPCRVTKMALSQHTPVNSFLQVSFIKINLESLLWGS